MGHLTDFEMRVLCSSCKYLVNLRMASNHIHLPPIDPSRESHASPHARDMPASTRKDVYEVDPALYDSHSKWLRSRGKGIRPHLTESQRRELETVFHLMDEDGSGSIDTKELSHAFKLLGFKLSKSEIQNLVDEVDHDHTGELEWSEFVEIFQETLRRLSEEKQEEGDPTSSKQSQVPLALMATAYRRKKILGGIFECSRESLAGVVKAGEDDKARTKAREAKEREAKSKGVGHQTLQAAAQASSLNPRDLLDLFSHDELKAVAESARASAAPSESKHLHSTSRLPPLGMSTSRSSPHIPGQASTLSPAYSHPLSPGPSPSSIKARAAPPRASPPSSFGEEWDRLAALTTSSHGGNDPMSSMVVPIKASKRKIARSKTQT